MDKKSGDQNRKRKTKASNSKEKSIWNYCVGAVLISLAVLIVINIIWRWVEINQWIAIPSPLNYREGLEMTVGVICSVFIATATFRIEKKWRDMDNDRIRLEQEQHQNELISTSIQNFSPFYNSSAVGYAIKDEVSLEFYIPSLSVKNYVFALWVKAKDNQPYFIPPQYEIISKDFHVEHLYLNEREITDTDKYAVEICRDGLLIYFTNSEISIKRELQKFLSDIVYFHQEQANSYFRIIFRASVYDHSIRIKQNEGKQNGTNDDQQKNILQFDCIISFDIVPVSAYSEKGTFQCQLCNASINRRG